VPKEFEEVRDHFVLISLVIVVVVVAVTQTFLKHALRYLTPNPSGCFFLQWMQYIFFLKILNTNTLTCFCSCHISFAILRSSFSSAIELLIVRLTRCCSFLKNKPTDNPHGHPKLTDCRNMHGSFVFHFALRYFCSVCSRSERTCL
jgi:hypothetical protein